MTIKELQNEGTIIETKLLDIIDNKTHDGLLTLRVLRQNGIALTNDIINAIQNLIRRGVLVKRNSYHFSAERPDNSRSKWGAQRYFDRYLHLTVEALAVQIAEDDEKHGLKVVILDDVSSAIHSVFVDSEADGASYFQKNYGTPYSFCFVRV